jgi:hypothetical protein
MRPPNDPARAELARVAAKNARATAAGSLFQQQVHALLKMAEQRGQLAYLAHNQPLFRPIGGGRFLPVAAGGADFYGMFPGGLSYAVEVKSYDEDRFYRSWVPAEQQRHLEQTARLGGLAVLVVQLRAFPGWPAWAVDWRFAPWRSRQSAPALYPEHLEGGRLVRPWLLAPFVHQCSVCHHTTLLHVGEHGTCTKCGRQ